MIVNNGIVRILFLLFHFCFKMDPIGSKPYIWLNGISIGFKIRNIIISLIHV